MIILIIFTEKSTIYILGICLGNIFIIFQVKIILLKIIIQMILVMIIGSIKSKYSTDFKKITPLKIQIS